jgi:transcriptional regulator with GAF, ATPase, and Fis domain
MCVSSPLFTVTSSAMVAVPGGGAVLAETKSDRTMDAVERDRVLSILRQTRGTIEGPKGAAAILGVNASTLRSRMKNLGIDRRSADGEV